MKNLASFVSVVVVSIAAPAFAQQPLPRAGEAMGTAQQDENHAAVTEHDFESDDVQGEMVRPLEEDVYAQKHRRTVSLITVRANFVAETMRTVEDL